VECFVDSPLDLAFLPSGSLELELLFFRIRLYRS
jgi:hypothetical protein